MDIDSLRYALIYLLKQNGGKITVHDHELLNFFPQKYSISVEYDTIKHITEIKLKETK